MIHNNSKNSAMRRRKYSKSFQFIKNKFLFVVTVGVIVTLALNICSGFTTTSTSIDVPVDITNSTAKTNLLIENTLHSYEENNDTMLNTISTSYYSDSETEPEIEPEPEPEPNYCIELTDDEIYMLATLVYLEGGIESLECQKAIASVVINRMNLWNMTLEEVIYQKNQFSPAYLIEDSTPNDIQIELIHELMATGVSIPEYVCYFRAGHYHRWKGMNDYTCLDRTYFSYSDRDYALWQEIIDDET